MKKYLLSVLLGFLMWNCAYSQVTCIFCYDQNAAISNPVNNLVLNGGFENGCFAYENICPNSEFYLCDVTNWTCSGGGFDTYASRCDTVFSAISEGIHGVYFGNSTCNACSIMFSDTSCINNVDCTVLGIPLGYPVNPNEGYGGDTGVSLLQTVTGLISGSVYVLEFWAGGEAGPTNSGLFAVDVGFGNIMLRNKPTPPTIGIGTRFIIEFIAVSSSHTIKFTNWGHIYGATELVLDDVRLYTLAELSSSVPLCSVGINLNEENTSVSIYPNPMTENLNINLTNNESSQLIIYDITSRIIFQQTFTNTISFNTAQFLRGVYFYEVRNKGGLIKQGKIVKD